MNNQVYLHIGNGGVSFEVYDDISENGSFGPTIKVSAVHFGNQTNEMKIHVTKRGLQAIADMFAEAASEDFSKEYVCAADYEDKSKQSGRFVANCKFEDEDESDGDSFIDAEH
ncbi:hypothetical protein ACOALA_13740 [Alicyclobacillus acidoterrestris]|uniref:hypothetical protein n=1 Tax=Alicyclobacillus TaxID=29330 RepID=UPI001A8F4205|nr:hypothetical protein [Alicyclobacillus suci]